MSQNIVIIGMMGSGKTTVGKLMSARYGLPLVDIDEHIEQREGRSIPDIFAQEGEPAFRAMELGMALELSPKQGMVIACGGGLPLQDCAIAALKENGMVFWLNADPGETYDHLDLSGRPLAQNGREDFIRRYRDRVPVYGRWADHVIEGYHQDFGKAAAQIFTIYTEVSKQ